MKVQLRHPDIIFLAEAFTRPKLMKGLAKLGFTQSYTYFTWRTQKWELEQYLNELTAYPERDFYRPNFFVNTPDILPYHLQSGEAWMFKSRVALAATLSGNYGIYNGFELLEHDPIPGREEYLDSEKYEIKVRDWDKPDNIKPYIRDLNRARRPTQPCNRPAICASFQSMTARHRFHQHPPTRPTASWWLSRCRASHTNSGFRSATSRSASPASAATSPPLKT